MTKPLSKTQRELLDAMRAGVRVIYMPYAGRFNPSEYYFRNDNYKRCTAAAKALKDRHPDLVRYIDKGHTGGELVAIAGPHD